MKSLLIAAALLGLPLGASAQPPLRPMSECLDPDHARGWHLIDSDELLVDAGRRKFLLTLAPACPELGFTTAIGFRSGDGIGRICGSPNDRVVFARRTAIDIPCRIAQVTPLTKEQYKQRLDGKKTKGKAQVHEDQTRGQAAQR